MKALVLVSGFLVFMFAAAPLASAKSKGYHTHDGFMLRLSGGFGSCAAVENGTGWGDIEVTGMGGVGSIALGTAVSKNLIINADMFSASMSEPDGKSSLGGGTQKMDKQTLTFVGFGPGVTYYIMPMNLYIAGSVGLAVAQNDDDGKTYDSDTGMGLNAMVGKEWWVSDNWGLGVAGQFMYMSMKDKEIFGEEDLGFASFGVLFTATYN